MKVFSNKIAFVVATKDRPRELQRLLNSLSAQTYLPDQTIIVDAGQKPLESVISNFQNLSIQYIHHSPPSTSQQRNVGVNKIHPDIALIGFLDDDVELKPDALEKMMEYWQTASSRVAGIAFNMENHPVPFAAPMKHLPIVEKLGLYSKKKGIVLPSAFQTMIGKVKRNTFVQWLPTTAVVWRRSIFDTYHFDEWFRGFSYLEDLEFSYRVGQSYQLMVLENARYYHYPDLNKKWNDFRFGKKEVFNRVYMVKKYREFSLTKCYLALLMRVLINMISFFQERKAKNFKRALGNIVGLIQSNLMMS